MSRNDPRISVKKLGDYLIATPAGRKRIIKQQKQPPGWVMRYTEAQNAITEHLSCPGRDANALLAAADNLRTTVATTETEAERNQLCAEAIERFTDVVDDLPIDGFTVQAGPNDPEKLPIGGVLVSVRPEVILRGTDRSGAPIIGAIKFCFAKSENLAITKESGGYIATTLHQYTERFAEPGMIVDRRRCLVLDVFNGNVHEAPASYRRRRADIEAACEEITIRWPTL